MEEGVTQGCPLSPLFASFVVAHLLEPINTLLRARATKRLALAPGDPGNDDYCGITHLLSYVGHIYTCVYLPDLKLYCNTLKTNSADLGCLVITTKTVSSPPAMTRPQFLSSPPPILNKAYLLPTQ
jgi:hypothetical protein